MYQMMLRLKLSALSVCLAQACLVGGEPDLQSTPVDSARLPAATAVQEWQPNEQFVVHEWGTFTSFSGSDGVFLDFRPLADQVNDLPPFVLSRVGTSPHSQLLKSRIRGKVRMETPVLYFYSDRVREVDVRVDFPEGLLTEFYPPVERMLPELDYRAAMTTGEPLGGASLDWGTVTILPRLSLAPQVADAELREAIAERIEQSVVPQSPGDRHYASARATDSALLHVRAPVQNFLGASERKQSHFEKFLFYRGVGKFEQPLSASYPAARLVSTGSPAASPSPTVKNQTELLIPAAIYLKVNGSKISVSSVQAVGPGQAVDLEITRETTAEELAATVVDTLTSQGLFRSEAAAMVDTWDDSWFTEEGSRVLYVVPAEVTDRVLPLRLDPVPDRMVRILVGRLDLLSPADEQVALRAVAESAEERRRRRESGEKGVVLPVPAAIARFGRMSEPVLARVAAIASDESARAEASILKQAHFPSQ